MTATATETTNATEPALRDVTPEQLKQWIDAGEAVIVDVREPDEHRAEKIAGSKLHALSSFDAASVPESKDNVRTVLHCRGGNRSKDAAGRLLKAGHCECYHLAGGIQAWKAAGLPVERAAKAPISIMRQVQIVAGSMVFAGTLLGVFVNPWFLVIPGFVGAGLTFAGASGFCGMAALLQRMPWNKIPA